MNEIVLNLAKRTAILLESVCHDQLQEIQPITVPYYFSRLGITSEKHQFQDEPVNVEELIKEINVTLNHYEKIYLLLLVQDCLLQMHEIPGFYENLRKIYERIGVDTALIKKFRIFFEHDIVSGNTANEFLLLSPLGTVDNEMLEGRWIEDNVPKGREAVGSLVLSQIHSHLLVMFVAQIRTYVIRCIDSPGGIFDQDISKYCNFRLLKPGSELSIDGVPVLTFSDIKSRFLQIHEKKELTLSIDRAQYTNKKGVREIHAISSREITGQLIGIVGREGVGKSTLLKLLAGKFKPSSGSISINGYDLWKNKYLLKGVIGFVPEEDLLFDDLSVADNLILTARLYYSNLTRKEIESRVNMLLSRLDLIEIKHMIVGNTENKLIQPGQRRLINIALELLREPQILLVDNALSGLGMSDANRVIKVLHDYSFSGNLVITSISQVDSETFRLFDKIWILDEGGHPVYNGPVRGASAYLFKNLNLNYSENEITDPSQLLDWVNYRLPDKDTHVWKRVVDPKGWHDEYLRNQALTEGGIIARTRLPAKILKIPNLEVQLMIFSLRNFKCKFSKVNEIVKAVLIGPLIALLAGFLFRTSSGDSYSFNANENIPLYQFISVVVAIFLGLIASVDEIIRERNILEKEQYQEFSRFSYLNSKILYLFPVVAFQILLYVLTGNYILGIREMYGVYWLVLFSSACFGVLLGLVISAAVTSRHFMYKALLPFIIAVQLILGGGIIAYDRLNLGHHKYTPLVGDLMVSRWGFEALAVEQFRNNDYEKLIYSDDKKLDQAAFYNFFVIPEMERSFTACFSSDPDTVRNNMILLQREIKRASAVTGVYPFEYVNRMPEIIKDEELAQEVNGYISTYLESYFADQFDTLSQQKSARMMKLTDSLGAGKFELLRKNYHNTALEQVVTNSQSDRAYKIVNNEIIRTSGIIYDTPDSEWGRAALFSPVKFFQYQQTETLWFNIAVIWLFTSLCYIWVLFDFSGIVSRGIKLKA